MSDLLPEGFRDRLHDEAETGANIVRRMMDVLTGHGYRRVQPPLAEFEAGLAPRGSSGDNKNLLRLIDPISQRMLAFRSDITRQVGRIARTRLSSVPRPVRLCYQGQVLKLRAGQLRPDRELVQIGAELIGSDTVAAARELVSIAIEALENAGAKGITVDLTLPDLVETLAKGALPLSSDKIDAVRAELDMKDAGALKQLGAEHYLPLLAATGPFEQAIERLAQIDAAGHLKSRIDGLREIAGPLADRVRVTLDPTERHGFEYQSWFGFSLYADGFVGSIGRGGTYYTDGEEGEAATGFSLYPDLLVATGVGRAEDRFLFVPLGSDATAVSALRAEGWRTVAALVETDDGQMLGCSHFLDGNEPKAY